MVPHFVPATRADAVATRPSRLGPTHAAWTATLTTTPTPAAALSSSTSHVALLSRRLLVQQLQTPTHFFQLLAKHLSLFQQPAHFVLFVLTLGRNLAVVVLLALSSLIRQWVATQRLLRRLLASRLALPLRVADLARQLDLADSLDYVDDDATYAFCYGLRRPRICDGVGGHIRPYYRYRICIPLQRRYGGGVGRGGAGPGSPIGLYGGRARGDGDGSRG